MTESKGKKLRDLITIAVNEGASDLHLSAGHYPTIRVASGLIPLMKDGVLAPKDTEEMIIALLGEENANVFFQDKEVDFSYSIPDVVRFRGNAFFQMAGIGIALRVIPSEIKTISELNLPHVLEVFARKKQGFFLAVGPVGQGKSTTLASMVGLINKERAEHIVTIEDPIEYLFKPDRSLIDQREVRINTRDFHVALESAFRQDVNVIMIGEMRSIETISAAVTAAETGHLVLSTLHTNNASQTVDRIIDSFPATQQPQIRMQLAGSLLGIFSQRLVPRASGGLIPAYELLIATNAVSSLIREGRTHELDVLIETGTKDGMIDMNRSLSELVKRGEITPDSAYQHSFNPKGLERML
ncbi:MAG: type IV pili twitching motility protein PilT [Candidatus Yonathbacteria bacterium CG_4_10_14_3_um_filter_47_65]|uniref:Type IV pili twitching motility protein PilT n=2 Tax=Parcubacteria group TaxID=1794811 RepID=A0A2M8D5Z9_9BACT|nr:MAG: type IV pili twitching motility protein PilT [Candidatus Nomurabacteria bacterium CG1_02_47_685]PIP04012.1 MAG: type IV pili twitching motility protein PilT [Candidatus Yonathbacteria bacterium CG23_combo_of_CG06-09_8_20_14_all_46_18]PIQ31228.1 MAG: type IV pili twitching motility protein PilT [Candidatus Yonathbacteria bacterium CG17_big_fil_post_rev_8_21_14_2_50_46_19]PIX56254.1 MAG: type IV pili twitching motility protein PilT [Candidatus Yonathbacteria bacterium CG_4_10_14_3_um_filte